MRTELTDNLDVDITALIDTALASDNPVKTILDSDLFSVSGQKKPRPFYSLYHPLKQMGHQKLLLPILIGFIKRHPVFASTISLENAKLIFQLLNPQTETDKAGIIRKLCNPDSAPAQMTAISILAGLMKINALYQHIATYTPIYLPKIALGAGMTANMDWCEQIAGTDQAKWELIARGAGVTANMDWCIQIAGTDQNKWELIAQGAGLTANMDWCIQIAGTDPNKWHHIAQGAGQSRNLKWCTELTEKDQALKDMIALGAGMTGDFDWCETLADKDAALQTMIAIGALTSNNIAFGQLILDKVKAHMSTYCHRHSLLLSGNIYPGRSMLTNARMSTHCHRHSLLLSGNIYPGRSMLTNARMSTHCHRHSLLLSGNIYFGRSMLTKANAHKDVSYPDIIETLISLATEHHREATLIDLLRATPHRLESSSRDTETARNNYRDFFKMCSNLSQYDLNNPLSMVTFYNQFPTELLAGTRLEIATEENHLKSAKICQSIISIREDYDCSSLTAEQLMHAAYENTPLALRTPLVFFSALHHSSARLDKRKTPGAQKQLATRRLCKLIEKELFGTHILPFLTTKWTNEQSLQLQPMFERKYAAAQHRKQEIKQQFHIQATRMADSLGLNTLIIRAAADLSAKDIRLISDIFFYKISKRLCEVYLDKIREMPIQRALSLITTTKVTTFLKTTKPFNITEKSYKDFGGIITAINGRVMPAITYNINGILNAIIDHTKKNKRVPLSRSTVDRRLFGPPARSTLMRIVETRTPTERETELKNASKITALTNIEEDLREWAFYP